MTTRHRGELSMCVNYQGPTRRGLSALLGCEAPEDLPYEREAWPGSVMPMIRRDPETGARIAEAGIFGLVPGWAKDLKIAKRCYNARSETVGEKPSFKHSWNASHLCLVPMTRYFEPNYESGKAVRWAIGRSDLPLFCVAGIWAWNTRAREGQGVASFSLLTVNCDQNPVLNRFHAPGHEKRSLVHIEPDDYDAWLAAPPDLARVMLEAPSPEVLEVSAAPLARKKASAD